MFLGQSQASSRGSQGKSIIEIYQSETKSK
jgi:hypothetical protein